MNDNYLATYCFVCSHAGNVSDCDEAELAIYGKLALLKALCRYWHCLPTSVKDNEQ